MITATPARQDPTMHKCPRCLRWTDNDGPAVECADGSPGVTCWRCQAVLVEHHPEHPATGVVTGWRSMTGLPNTIPL